MSVDVSDVDVSSFVDVSDCILVCFNNSSSMSSSSVINNSSMVVNCSSSCNNMSSCYFFVVMAHKVMAHSHVSTFDDSVESFHLSS